MNTSQQETVSTIALTRYFVPDHCRFALAFIMALACNVSIVHASTAIALNGQRVELENLGASVFDTAQGIIKGTAHAKVLVDDFKTDSTPKQDGQAGDTGVALDSGGGATAQSRAKWNVSFNPLSFLVGPDIVIGTAGSFARVTSYGLPGVASTTIMDPAVFDSAAGQTFSQKFGFDSGFNIEADGMAYAEVDTSAGSDIPGLGMLFSLSIILDGSNPSNLVIDFMSNPLLGVDDTAISNMIRSNLIYDPSQNEYSSASSFDYADFLLTVPLNQDSVSFSWVTGANVFAVPEPADIFLIVAGLTVLMVRQGTR